MHSWNVHMLLTCKRHQIFTFSGKHLFTCSATVRWESRGWGRLGWGGVVWSGLVWSWEGGRERERVTNRAGVYLRLHSLQAQQTHTQCFTQRQKQKHTHGSACATSVAKLRCSRLSAPSPWWLSLDGQAHKPPRPSSVCTCHSPLRVAQHMIQLHQQFQFHCLTKKST